MKPVFLFILGLVLLIKAGDWFVDGATDLAHRLHIPELIIGATIVSIGTTLPEVMVSATSAVSGHSQISYGNAIGSIICNTALIAAITMAVRPCSIDKKALRSPVLFFFTAAGAYTVVAYTLGRFSRLFGILMLGMFLVYMFFTIAQGRKEQSPEEDAEEPAMSLGKELLLLIVGAALIAIGANLLVDNGTLIAQALGVPESVIALTMVALGTSLPELATAVTALIKGHSALSLGNIIGANFFNLVLVCGISTALAPFDLPSEKLVAGCNAALLIELPLMLLVMLILTVPALLKGKLTRLQGLSLLALYTGFCMFQFMS